MGFKIKEIPKGTKKTAQMVWLEPKVMAKILEISDEHGLAPNVVISLIVKEALFGEGKSPIVKREEVKKKVVVCPFCLGEFEDVSGFQDHIIKSHSQVWKILQKEFVGGV